MSNTAATTANLRLKSTDNEREAHDAAIEVKISVFFNSIKLRNI